MRVVTLVQTIPHDGRWLSVRRVPCRSNECGVVNRDEAKCSGISFSPRLSDCGAGLFKDWLPICRALYSYSGVREYVFQRFQQFGGGGYQSGVGAAHVDARDEVARVEGTIGFRHKCPSLALDYGITSDWANTPRSRRVLVHFPPPSFERDAMLDASLRKTHTYWPSTII